MAPIRKHARGTSGDEHARTAPTRERARIAFGLTAAGLAGTAALLGPAPAQASSVVNWDAIAQCESGGNWSINTGNGYYGGLQFSKATWRAFRFYVAAEHVGAADKASRAEQIRIAEKVLRAQGLGAWPSCGRKGSASRQYHDTNADGSKSTNHEAPRIS